MKTYDLLILGGGASGLAAAVEAAEQGIRRIAVVEKLDRVGKKILATGNGRCNLLNTAASPKDYNNPAFAEKVFSAVSVKSNLDFFHHLGLLTTTDTMGRVYPRSNAAASVLDVLRFACERLGVTFLCGTPVTNLVYKKGQFLVNNAYAAPVVIVTCGGKAAPAQGSDGSGYGLLQEFGHHVSALHPALVQIRTKQDFVKSVKGLRAQVALSLREKNGKTHRSEGELLFTDYGLSGIAVMDLSRYAKEGTTVEIDFLPEYTAEEIFTFLQNARSRNASAPIEQLPVGILHNRIGQVLLRSVPGVSLSAPCKSLSDKQLRTFSAAIKQTAIPVLGTKGFPDAQVTAGGADVKEFTKDLESCHAHGLFAAGEILDIDGKCGGYNLTFAWSSGRLAARGAAKILLKDKAKRVYHD